MVCKDFLWFHRLVSSFCWLLETILSPLYSLRTLVKVIVSVCKNDFESFSSGPWVYLPVLMPLPHSFDCCDFAICFEFRKYEASIFVLAIKIALALWGSLWFPTYFKKKISLSIKCHWISVRCCSESVHHFGWYGNLNNIDFSVWTWHFIPTLFSVQLLSWVQLFETPRAAVHQASLFFTISWSLLKFMAIELVMLSFQLVALI